MKLIKLALVGLAALSLFACNNGGSSTSDVQNQSISGGTEPNTYALNINATGCQTISSNGGTCTVVLSYRGTGNFGNQLPNFSSGTTGYTTNINQMCGLASSSSSYNNPCTITITSNNGTNTNNKQTAVISLGGTQATISFNLGGGL